jgi:hypothetical protein
VSQLFDPSYAAANLTPAFVTELCESVPALSGVVAALQAEIQAYQVAARAAPALDHKNMKAYTDGVLLFWRTHGTKDACMARRSQDYIRNPANLRSL